MIDRIEIVRGPRSSLYGSEAIGGVIQVFTRRDRGGFAPRFPPAPAATAAAKLGVGIGGGSDTAGSASTAGAPAHRRHQRLQRLLRPDHVLRPAASSTARPTATVTEHALSLRGGVNFGDAWSSRPRALRAERRQRVRRRLHRPFRDRAAGRRRRRCAGTPSSASTVQLAAGRNNDESDNFLGDTLRRLLRHQPRQRHAAGRLRPGRGPAADRRLRLAARPRRGQHRRTTDDERDNQAAFAQYQGKFGAQTLQASVRRDDNEQFGGNTTGSAAWGLRFAENWRVTAGYGTAFKAPTFNELYFPFFGNPNLRPENRELGARPGADAVTAGTGRLDAFETRVDDLIAYDAAHHPAQQHREGPHARRRARCRRSRRLASTVPASSAGHREPRTASTRATNCRAVRAEDARSTSTAPSATSASA